MTFTLDSFLKIGRRTNFVFPDELLSGMPCGLFRASFDEATMYLPQVSDLLWSCPVAELDEYEFDVKIHMLMPGQYPCVPNWHCDNVARDENRRLDYAGAKVRGGPPMLLWVSNGPHTEFLNRPVTMPEVPKGHDDVAEFIKLLRFTTSPDVAVTTFLPEQQWVKFSSTAPHRGCASDRHQWRVFVRATHKSVLPVRPKVHVVRRHAQVYLDAATFAW